MKILDINTGIGRPLRTARFTDAEGLLRYMDDYGIAEAVTYHAEALREPYKGNALMLEQAKKTPRLRPCLVVDASLDDLGIPGEGDVLQRLKASKAVALRMFPVNQRQRFHSFYGAAIFEVANALRMPIIVTPPYKPEFWQELPRVAADYPNMPIIILQFGFNHSRTVFPVLKNCKNVYFDISHMLDCGQVEEICQKYGSSNLLFGTNLPHHEPSGPLGLLLYNKRITPQQQEDIACGNWLRLEGGILL